MRYNNSRHHPRKLVKYRGLSSGTWLIFLSLLVVMRWKGSYLRSGKNSFTTCRPSCWLSFRLSCWIGLICAPVFCSSSQVLTLYLIVRLLLHLTVVISNTLLCSIARCNWVAYDSELQRIARVGFEDPSTQYGRSITTGLVSPVSEGVCWMIPCVRTLSFSNATKDSVLSGRSGKDWWGWVSRQKQYLNMVFIIVEGVHSFGSSPGASGSLRLGRAMVAKMNRRWMGDGREP